MHLVHSEAILHIHAVEALCNSTQICNLAIRARRELWSVFPYCQGASRRGRWAMRQPPEAVQHNLAARGCGPAACWDDARVAQRLYRQQGVAGGLSAGCRRVAGGRLRRLAGGGGGRRAGCQRGHGGPARTGTERPGGPA